MTRAGMLSLLIGGRREDPIVGVCAEWLSEHPIPRRGRIEYFYYGCHYCSLAMAQAGGEHGNRFFPRLVKRLLSDQAPDGSWPDESLREEHWGPCYSTVLAILSLTPPDQLLPIYQR